MTAANPDDAILVQSGGLGGPYQAIAAANLVATALENTADTMRIGGTLEAGGDLIADTNAGVAGYLNVGGDLNVAGNVKFTGTIDCIGGIYTAGPLNVVGAVDLGSSLLVQGAADIAGGFVARSNSLIDGALTVQGALAVSGPLSASGPFYMAGDGSFTGNLMAGGGAQFGGGAKFGGGIYTAGSITAEGGLGLLDCLSVGKDVTIGGSATINGNLTAPGRVELGPTGITGDLGVFGNLCLAGNFTAEGISKLTAGEMCVTGDVGICGALDVAGLIQAGSLLVKDGVSTCGDVSIGGRLNVARGGSFHGPTDIQGDLTVNGRVGICGFLHLNGMAVATEPWVTGYVCHVGADLLSALSDTAQELESKITASIAGVASFNYRTGAVVLTSDDVTGVDGVLRPAGDSGLWYAWHDGDWAAFEPGSGGGGGDGGIPEPTGTGLFGRNRNGGTSWQPVPPLPPSDATTYYAWRNGAWTAFDPGAGGGGGITQQQLDAALANYLPLAGGILSGALTLPSADATGNQAVRYAQLNTALGGYLPITGGTLQGPLVLPADGNGSQAVRYSQLSGFATTTAMSAAIATATAGMATQSWVGGQIADMATQTWTGGQISTAIASVPSQSWVNGQISTATTGMATQSWVGNNYLPLNSPLQIAMMFPGTMPAGQVYNFPIGVPILLDTAALPPATSWTQIPQGAIAILQVNKVSSGSTTGIGNIQFSGSLGGAVFNITATSFAKGDALQIVAPDPSGATLRDVGITLLATRT